MELHKKWLDTDGKEGKRADISGSDLRRSNLFGSDLSGSYLSRIYLFGSDLRASDISESDIRRSNLFGSDLRGSDLRRIRIDEKACESLGGEVVEGVCKAEIKVWRD